jgi:hypothetical protein
VSAIVLAAFLTASDAAGPSIADGEGLPMADVHLHYDWDQAEILDTAGAVARLEANGIVFGVVSSTPPALALALAAAAGDWLVPLFTPYLEPDRKLDWFHDRRVLPATREALASGRYQGIGEVHLIAGFAPPLKAHNETVDGLLALAVEFDVPVSIHAEASSHRYFQPLCERHPRARIFWAHAGGVLPASAVAALLRACPNVWVDLSARDPARYGGMHPIVDDSGRLVAAWEALVLEFRDRVLVGSDPFFRAGGSFWDGPNTGWDHLHEYVDFHRRWISFLPDEIAERVRLTNALRFFRAPRRPAPGAGNRARQATPMASRTR